MPRSNVRKKKLAKDVFDVLKKVYPNPTSGNLTIEAEGMTEVSVYNTLGQCVLQKEVAGEQTTVNLQQVSEGLYLLRVKTAEGVISKRITLKH